MTPRMLCTQCSRTAVADTLLPGSDRVEMIAWCAFAIPGLLYCGLRHALRIKVCAFCGSDDLVREARAAAARVPLQAPPADGPRITDPSGRRRWPDALASPRERLRHGAIASVFAAGMLLCSAAAPLDFAQATFAAQAGTGFAALTLGWLMIQVVRVSRLQGRFSGCRAWDAAGRPLQIERIG
jgi:hypothetical protein